MPESRPSDQAQPSRDYSVACVAVGLLSLAVGATLFHPGAGLVLVGLVLTGVGLFGGPGKA